MFRYFLHLSYDGTKFHGWQIQPNSRTVQEELTNALQVVLREKIQITGAGRTDTGVHASNFFIHFDSCHAELHESNKVIHSLNGILSDEIGIFEIFKVNSEAHARFDALSRLYNYYIHFKKDPFLRNTSLYLSVRPDIQLMNIAAKELFNFTDFTSFSKLHTQTKTNDCKILRAEWNYISPDQICFTIEADRFLRNMVRSIVGTLLEVGYEKISLVEFQDIIKSKNRNNAGKSVEAKGLFLHKITYPNHIFFK